MLVILNTIGFACAYQVLRLLKAFWESLFSKHERSWPAKPFWYMVLVGGVGGWWAQRGSQSLRMPKEKPREAQRGSQSLRMLKEAQRGSQSLRRPKESVRTQSPDRGIVPTPPINTTHQHHAPTHTHA